MGYSVELLNSIRAEASQDYKNRIPEATQTNIATSGQAFETYTVLFNEFAEALVNKIGRTMVEAKSYKNRLERFKTGGVVSPHDVEEIFVSMLKAEGAYDPDGKNPLGRRGEPDVKVIYHRQNRQDVYAMSLGDIDFVRVFRSEATLDSFVTAKFTALYSGDARDEYALMKNLIGSYKNKSGACGYFDYEVTAMEDQETKEAFAKDIVKATRKAVMDMGFLSDKYNVAGVETLSEAKDLVMLVNKDVLVEVDVELLAKAFHQSNTDMKVVPTIIPMDDFGDITADTYGIIMDKDWFRVWDTLVHMESQRNAQGLFTNWFYHHHQILSASTFKNAVRLKKKTA